MNCFHPFCKLVLAVIVLFTSCSLHTNLFAQITLEVSIDAGTVSSTCEDPIIGGNNPTFEVNIDNQGWQTYPSFLGLCYNNTPNVQFSNTYSCPGDVPADLEICFKVYDEDGLPCNQTTEDCLEEKCETFTNPSFGTSLSDSIVIDGTTMLSTGTLSFTITTSETTDATNDDPCDAIDFGVLPSLGTLGDMVMSSYNNICADGIDEPNPLNETGWDNNQGVWFKFTTSNNPSSIINILATDDPGGVGDGLNIQLAFYETSNNECTGTFNFIESEFVDTINDEVINAHCLAPDKTYFILVDGSTEFPGGVEGWFGIQISDVEVVDGADQICDAENLGAVPDDGMISTGLTQSNACANAIGDGGTNSFDIQQGVWYEITAPPSGNILVEGISEPEYPNGLDPIDIQVALFGSSNNTCNGTLSEINSSWTVGDVNESITANCLTPGAPYWIMIDGSGFGFSGVFEVKVSDTGFFPTTQLDTTICAESVFVLGEDTFVESGPYSGSIINANNCVIPVQGVLSFYDPVVVSISQITAASDVGIADGIANAGAFGGGTGNFTYQWSDGQTTQIATGLIGGENYCVTATDGAGCQDETCFEVEYLLPLAINSSSFGITCFDGNDGSISLSVINGDPTFSWTFVADVNTVLNSNGTIQMLGDEIVFDELPADTYTITLSNANSTEVYEFILTEPEPFIAEPNVISQISCFDACDASVEISFIGGTNPPPSIIIDQVCPGTYSDTYTDGNGCAVELTYQVLAPAQIFAVTFVNQDVSCFGLSDGSANVLLAPDTEIQTVLWDNGETTITATNLTAGIHTVTVVDINGCEWTGAVPIEGPENPIAVEFTTSGLACNGDADGVVTAKGIGGYEPYVYSWDTGQAGANLTGVSGGTYTVSILDAGGCEISVPITINEPTPIVASLLVEDGQCAENGDINGGILTIDEVSGGIPPYQYSLGTDNYGDENSFENLAEGPFTVSLIDDKGCVQFYDADIIAADSVQLSLQATQSVFNGDSTTIFLNTDNSNLTYEWSPDNDLSCNNCQNPVVTPTVQTLYTVVAIDTTTNCQSSAQIVIGVSDVPNIFIPNVFSPNGDGQNDALQVFIGSGIETVLEFEIFDRWGNTKFGAQNFSEDLFPGWDGNFKGIECPPAIYPFVVKYRDVTGAEEYKTGTISLLR